MFNLLQLTVRCTDIPVDEIPNVARAVETDFRKYRPWHQNVRCQVDGIFLVLRAQNDLDDDGEALCEEFRSCLKEYASTFGSIEVVAIEPLTDPPLGDALVVPRSGMSEHYSDHTPRRSNSARQC